MSETKDEAPEAVWVDGRRYVRSDEPAPATTEIELKSLVGVKRLDAVDFANEKRQRWGDEWEDCSVCRFRLDGKTYMAIEDPSDGYRSSLASLAQYESEVPLQNVFPAVQVLVRHRAKGSNYNEADVLEMLDLVTGEVVLEVGTDNSDDYYPSFVASFNPENMAINKIAPEVSNDPA